MIEKIILDYLSEKLNIPVYMENPPTLPEKFIVVDKTGSGRKDFIKSATVAIQSYNSTKAKTASLNEQIKDAMFKMIVLNNISKVELNTDYPFNDISNKRYRYQAVFDIVYM